MLKAISINALTKAVKQNPNDADLGKWLRNYLGFNCSCVSSAQKKVCNSCPNGEKYFNK